MVIFRSLSLYCRSHLGEFLRFAVVGLATFGVNFVSFAVLFGLLGCDYRVAVSLAYGVTVFCHFMSNKLFTFRAKEQAFSRNTPRYILMLGLNYCITLVASWMTVEVLHLSPYFTVIASTGGTAVTSFFVMKYFVFRPTEVA